MEKKSRLDFITVVALLVGLVTIFFQIFPPKTPIDQVRSAIYFLAILGYIGFLYFVMWATDRIKLYIDQISKNKKDIQELKERMETEKHFNEVEKRLSVLEALLKNKKGRGLSIDPKWIFLIILLILFYLYLRSLGILK